MDDMHAKIEIAGDVQGVGFRAGGHEQLRRLGLEGRIWNEPTGRVRGVFEGDAQAVEDMVAWCRQGPPAATVRNVDVRKRPAGEA